MEDFLNSLGNLTKCMEGQKENISTIQDKALLRLCLPERIAFAQALNSEKMRTRNLIPERLKIIEEQKKLKVSKRRDELDSVFK
jgi:hypothetical protein